MDELRAVPWNGYTVASLFAGAGGSSLGYRLAGFRVLYANEFIREAAAVYRANAAPYTRVDERDVRTVTGDDVRAELDAAWRVMARSGLDTSERERPELDVLDGSPPCRSFSTAGRRSAMWGKSKQYSEGVSQRDDDLFYEYARLLAELRPRLFVAENVTGLIKGVSKGYFKQIVARLAAAGYVVRARVLDASRLGVPQARQRVFLVGVRDDLAARGIEPRFPTPLPYAYSVRDAIGDLATVVSAVGGKGAVYAQKGARIDVGGPAPTIVGGQGARGSHQIYVDAEIEGSTGFDGHAGRSLDEPMESVLARRSVSVVHSRKLSRSQDADARDVTDLPAPTITNGVGASNSNHFGVNVGVGRGKTRSLDEPAPTILQHGRAGTRSELSLGLAVGREYDKLLPGESSDRYFSLVRPRLDAPSPTLTAIGGTPAAGVAHPTERRKFTIAELRRVCSFPDDFVLLGTYAQQWERLGRAVPPLMMRALASSLRDVLAAADGASLPEERERETT